MKLILIILLLVFSSTAIVSSCSTAKEPIDGQTDRVTITDFAGRQWDVTHARDVYDMNPDYFNFGLGIGAIPSVDNPTILEEGDPGYPEADSLIRVFGVNHNGEQRGYNINDLSLHEVFNDIYPGPSDEYVAVTY
jgi:ABC-type Fe3+-hydroxamate transport system substrate-binding protein